MASSKRFRIGFYSLATGADGKSGSVCDQLLASLDSDKMTKALKLGENVVQVRGVAALPANNGVMGYVARFRDEAPLAGTPDSPIETLLQLGQGQGLIERNHFIIFKEREGVEIVAYQAALEGTHISGLARYLSSIFGVDRTVSANEVLRPDAYKALDGGGVIKSIDFRVAKPRSKRFAPNPEDTWTQEGIEFMNSTGATSYEVKVSTRKRGEGLVMDVKKRINGLIQSPLTKKLKVKMSDIEEPIDLLAARLTEKITVLPKDGAIQTSAVLDAIRSAKIRVQSQLDEIFGLGDEALD